MVNPLANAGKYSKFIVSALGTVSTALTTFYGSAHWVPTVLVGLSALGIYLVPNQSNQSSTQPPAAA